MREEAISLRIKGNSYAEIGRKLGLSRQRIHQIVTGYKTIDQDNFNKKLRLLANHDGKSCFVCSRKDRLEVHHLDGNSRNDDDSNKGRVCTHCHKLIHSRVKFFTSLQTT